MTKARRVKLNAVIEALRTLKDNVEEILDEEDTAMSNMPESLQESDRYYAMEDACDSMSDAMDAIDEAIDSLESAVE